MANNIQIKEPDGFQVGSDQNVNIAIYHYVAWNAVPGAADLERLVDHAASKRPALRLFVGANGGHERSVGR